jgi:hypothetical protein
MTEHQTTETEHSDQTTPEAHEDTQEAQEAAPETPETPETPEREPETFPREYVAKLRDESARHRQRAADRDDLAQRLHGALVAATGRLADPSDLTFDDAHLDDPDALSAAIEHLLARKPHLANRRPVGDVGQGVASSEGAVDLAGLLRRNS